MRTDPENFTLAGVLQKATKKKGRPLTSSEVEKLEALVSRLEGLEAQLPELEAENACLVAAQDEEAARLAADKVVKRWVREARRQRNTAESRAKLLAEREGLLDDLRARGFQINVNTGSAKPSDRTPVEQQPEAVMPEMRRPWWRFGQ